MNKGPSMTILRIIIIIIIIHESMQISLSMDIHVQEKFKQRIRYLIFLLPISIQYPADFILTGILGICRYFNV